ncbi:MAG: Trm112 family protein [Candidatus Omnitrophota bacterium]
MIDENLMNILVCPVCKEKLDYRNEKMICSKCKKAYPVKSGIPVMLIEEAEDIT